MKKAKRMIALVALLAIVIAATVAINHINAAKEDGVSENAGTYRLTEHEKSDVSGLEWTKGEKSLSFKMADGAWQYASDAAYPVNQTAVQTLSDDAMALTAARKLENIESMADYGLDEPTFTLRITHSDASEVTYSLGDQTPFQDGYYLSVSGQSNTVYVVEDDFTSDFSLSLFDYAQTETLPEIGEVTAVEVGGAFKAEYLLESKTIDKDQNWYSVSSAQPLDDEKMESLIEEAENLSLGALQTYNASDETLETYALTEEAATKICLRDADGNERCLYVGKTDEGADEYVRLKDSRMVYLLSGSSGDVLTADEAELRSLSVAPAAFEDVKSFSVSLGDASYQIERTETVVPATSGEAEETNVSVTRNGNETDGTQEEAVWKLISALKATAHAEYDAPENEILSVSVTAENEKSLEITTYEYDADNYLLLLSDDRALLVSADEIDKIIRHFKQF